MGIIIIYNPYFAISFQHSSSCSVMSMLSIYLTNKAMICSLRPLLVVYGVRVRNVLIFSFPYTVHVFCIASHTEYVYECEIKFRTNFFCTKFNLQFVHSGKVYGISFFWKFSILLHLIIAPSHCNNRSEPTTSQQVVDKSSRVS